MYLFCEIHQIDDAVENSGEELIDSHTSVLEEWVVLPRSTVSEDT